MYDIGEELWVLKRPSVVEMKRQYEDMVTRLNNGDPIPFRSTNIEKIMYLRRKRLQDQVPSQDKRPKITSRFSLSIPLHLPEVFEGEEDEREEHYADPTNTKRIESIEEWWSDFHTPNATIKYAINIGSLSIGDQAVIELAQKLNNLITFMPSPPIVHSLDISWNDLYEEGMIAFCGMVEHLSGLSEVRLDGNQIGTAGLEAFLKALVHAQPEVKKRSTSYRKMNGSGANRPGTPLLKRSDGINKLPGVSLSLRETNIGDDSTPCLASFLKPVPDNNQLNLVSLDLTNTYIFDGITALTLGLQNNTTLTTLILNSNMIGDQGAFAIGELLLTNRTLSKLEIRNCDIGPTGTQHLCEGMMAHKGLKNEEEVFTIDLGLNPWEFAGELVLLQTVIAKPKMVINWREGEWTVNEDELMTLIRTFGETVVMDRLLEGKGLLPLASPAQLIASPLIAVYAPIHVATTIDTLNPTSNPNALALLTMIVQLMEAHGRTSYKSWMSVLPSVLTHLCSWMDPFTFISSAHSRRQMEVLTLDLLLILGNINQYIIDDFVVRSGIINLCLENFLTFPNHNVFHLRLIKLVEGLCAIQTSGTLRTCIINLITGDFFTRLLAVIKEQSLLPVRGRSGSLVAAAMFAKVIEPYLETRLSLTIKKLLKQYDEEQRGSLVEPPPKRTQANLVLNKDVEI